MSKMNLMETSIPVDLVTNLKLKACDFIPAWSYKLYDTLFKSMADLLAIIKRKDQKSAIAIKDINGNLVLAAVVEYHQQSSDEEVGGNWSFTMTTDPEDIKDGETNIKYITDNEFQRMFATVGRELYNLKITDSLYIVEYSLTSVTTLLDNLRVNAKEGDVYEVEDEGYFIASSAVEGGEVVISITPGDKLKTLIKDDTAGEAA